MRILVYIVSSISKGNFQCGNTLQNIHLFMYLRISLRLRGAEPIVVVLDSTVFVSNVVMYEMAFNAEMVQ
jgi:hypothetical protein